MTMAKYFFAIQVLFALSANALDAQVGDGVRQLNNNLVGEERYRLLRNPRRRGNSKLARDDNGIRQPAGVDISEKINRASETIDLESSRDDGQTFVIESSEVYNDEDTDCVNGVLVTPYSGRKLHGKSGKSHKHGKSGKSSKKGGKSGKGQDAETASPTTPRPVIKCTPKPTNAPAPAIPVTDSPTQKPTSLGATSNPTPSPNAEEITYSPTRFLLTKNPTVSPVASATDSPVAGSTSNPTAPPIEGATQAPTPVQTDAPTVSPVVGATSNPTAAPIVGATPVPTTAGATSSPTASPVTGATSNPTAAGATPVPTTAGATSSPTASPVAGATSSPTASPVAGATSVPTVAGATSSPTASPVAGATSNPTASGTSSTTSEPSISISSAPTSSGTGGPPTSPSPTFDFPADAIISTSFEQGDFPGDLSALISTDGDEIWALSTESANSGARSIKSGFLNDGSLVQKNSNVTFTSESTFAGGFLNLNIRAAVEIPIDDLFYFINGEFKGNFVGNTEWQELSIPLAAGENTVMFSYKYNPIGLDALPPPSDSYVGAAFIDDVYITPIGTGTVPTVSPTPGASATAGSPAPSEAGTLPGTLSPKPTLAPVAGGGGDCVALTSDDFESGIFPNTPWTTGGDGEWTIDDTRAFEGTYSIKSPDLDGSETPVYSNATFVTCSDFLGGVLTAQVLASVLPPSDIFFIYVDGESAAQLVDVQEFTEVAIGIPPGVHTVDFSYRYNFFGANPLPPSPPERLGAVWLDNISIATI